MDHVSGVNFTNEMFLDLKQCCVSLETDTWSLAICIAEHAQHGPQSWS